MADQCEESRITCIEIKLTPSMSAALDKFIASQPSPLSRDDAAWIALHDWLTSQGLMADVGMAESSERR